MLIFLRTNRSPSWQLFNKEHHDIEKAQDPKNGCDRCNEALPYQISSLAHPTQASRGFAL